MTPQRCIIELISMLEPRHLNLQGRFGLFTAFLDESGTHGERSKNTVMAGFVGNEREWMLFEDGWKRLLEEYPQIETVHGKDLVPKRGFYYKWPSEQYWQFIVKIAGLIRSCRILAMLVAVDNDGYVEYRNRLVAAKRGCDSAYGMCFRYCMMKWHPTG